MQVGPLGDGTVDIKITCCEAVSYDNHVILFRARPWRLCRLVDVFPMAYHFIHLQIPSHHYGFPRMDLIDRAPSTPS